MKEALEFTKIPVMKIINYQDRKFFLFQSDFNELWKKCYYGNKLQPQVEVKLEAEDYEVMKGLPPIGSLGAGHIVTVTDGLNEVKYIVKAFTADFVRGVVSEIFITGIPLKRIDWGNGTKLIVEYK